MLGVDGFFIISGYLITKSFLSSPTLFDYLKRRVLRIYPALHRLFLAMLARLRSARRSRIVAVPSGRAHSQLGANGASFPSERARESFPGMPLPGLNGSMWSIPYEFQLLHSRHVSRRRRLSQRRHSAISYSLRSWPAVAVFGVRRLSTVASVLAATILGSLDTCTLQTGSDVRRGSLVRFSSSATLSYNHALGAIAAVALIDLPILPPLVAFALGVFGGYLIFWFAFHCPVLPISRFTNKTDLSYGIYLYAWPIQSTIAFFTDRGRSTPGPSRRSPWRSRRRRLG